MRILFLSHSDPFGPFRVGSHHLAGALAREGHDVVHLSTPISAAHLITGRVTVAKARATPRDSVGADGVRYIVPRGIFPAGLRPYGTARALRRMRIVDLDLVLLDQPLLWSGSLRAIAGRIVYRPTDEYPNGIKARLQRKILRHVDGVIATSSEVLRRLGDINVPSSVIENGVDIERFRLADDAIRVADCVYVGAFDTRFDWEQTAAWASEFPTWRFRLVGPVCVPPVPMPTNVELVGPVHHDELPGLLNRARVGMLPLSSDPLNQGRSPMKLYEYLATGLAVVSRQTAVIRSDPRIGIYTFESETGASRAMRDAMSHRSPNNAGVQRASQQSWTTKSRILLDFVASLP